MVIKVSLLYSPSESEAPVCFVFELPPGSRVLDALTQPEFYGTFPEARHLSVGIYGQLVSLDRILADQDRIEVYRALSIDPKEARKKRAKKL